MISIFLTSLGKAGYFCGILPMFTLIHSLPLGEVVSLAPILDLLNSNIIIAKLIAIIILSFTLFINYAWLFLNNPLYFTILIFTNLFIFLLNRIFKSYTFYICNGSFNFLVKLLGNFSNYKFTDKTAKIIKYI